MALPRLRNGARVRILRGKNKGLEGIVASMSSASVKVDVGGERRWYAYNEVEAV